MKGSRVFKRISITKMHTSQGCRQRNKVIFGLKVMALSRQKDGSRSPEEEIKGGAAEGKEDIPKAIQIRKKKKG